MKHGKKYQKAIKEFEDKTYELNDAIDAAKKSSYSKFPGTISLHASINLPKDKDPKSIKGSLSLPHPIAQTQEVKIVAFCNDEDAEKAKAAGAIDAGLDKLIKRIEDGWLDFDVVLATPEVMGQIAKLGRQLGPKGLMPSPKTGTLTDKIVDTIEEFKKGKANFSCDSSGAIHIAVGKVDTDTKDISENIMKAISQIADSVGKKAELILKTLYVSPTMGVGVKINTGSLFSE